MVGEHEANLGAAEAGQSGILCQRQIEIMVVVDDVGGGDIGVLRVDADLRIGAGHRIGDADHHFGRLRAGRDRRESGGSGGSKQYIAARDRHCKSPFERLTSMKRLAVTVKPQ